MNKLSLGDKIAMALCYADAPVIDDYICKLDYYDNIEEGTRHFKLGKKLLKDFNKFGFTVGNLKEILDNTNWGNNHD